MLLTTTHITYKGWDEYNFIIDYCWQWKHYIYVPEYLLYIRETISIELFTFPIFHYLSLYHSLPFSLCISEDLRIKIWKAQVIWADQYHSTNKICKWWTQISKSIFVETDHRFRILNITKLSIRENNFFLIALSIKISFW